MVGEIFEDHVRQDIVDAKALGLDGFALNYSMSELRPNLTTIL